MQAARYTGGFDMQAVQAKCREYDAKIPWDASYTEIAEHIRTQIPRNWLSELHGARPAPCGP